MECSCNLPDLSPSCLAALFGWRVKHSTGQCFNPVLSQRFCGAFSGIGLAPAWKPFLDFFLLCHYGVLTLDIIILRLLLENNSNTKKEERCKRSECLLKQLVVYYRLFVLTTLW